MFLNFHPVPKAPRWLGLAALASLVLAISACGSEAQGQAQAESQTHSQTKARAQSVNSDQQVLKQVGDQIHRVFHSEHVLHGRACGKKPFTVRCFRAVSRYLQVLLSAGRALPDRVPPKLTIANQLLHDSLRVDLKASREALDAIGPDGTNGNWGEWFQALGNHWRASTLLGEAYLQAGLGELSG